MNLSEVVAVSWAQGAPVAGPLPATTRLHLGDFITFESDEETGESWSYIDWDAAFTASIAVGGPVQVAQLFDSSGYSPRFYGETTVWVDARRKGGGVDFRLLVKYAAGGKWAKWGYRTPLYYSEPTLVDNWVVLEKFPGLPS